MTMVFNLKQIRIRKVGANGLVFVFLSSRVLLCRNVARGVSLGKACQPNYNRRWESPYGQTLRGYRRGCLNTPHTLANAYIYIKCPIALGSMVKLKQLVWNIQMDGLWFNDEHDVFYSRFWGIIYIIDLLNRWFAFNSGNFVSVLKTLIEYPFIRIDFLHLSFGGRTNVFISRQFQLREVGRLIFDPSFNRNILVTRINVVAHRWLR